MIDYFAIALTHGLIALAAWRLCLEDAVDSDPDYGDRRSAAMRKSNDA